MPDLKQQGYTFALDDFVEDARFEPLTQIAKLIKVDMRTTTKPEQERLLRTYQPRGDRHGGGKSGDARGIRVGEESGL